MIAVVKRHAAAVSRQYVRLFLEHGWEPFEEAGEPEERWGEMRETLRPPAPARHGVPRLHLPDRDDE